MKRLFNVFIVTLILCLITVPVFSQDSDNDGVADDVDNCPVTYNPDQEDRYPLGGNGCGDACECEGNFDGDDDQDGSDAFIFKDDFGRGQYQNPCPNCVIDNWCGIGYSLDFLETGNPGGWTSSLKTFDQGWTMNQGQVVAVDIWLNNVPENLLTSGYYIQFDPALVNITSITAYDNAYGGPWDAGLTTSFEFQPGEWFLTLGNLACVSPDAGGDVILARVTFECQAVGDANITIEVIDGFDGVVGCVGGTVYDSQIAPRTITIQQE